MLAPLLLLLLSPFALACAIASSPRAMSFVARHYIPCMVTGWTAVALLGPAAVALSGATRAAALAVICPFIALSFWRREGGGGGGEWRPRPEGPDVPEIDWARFQQDLDRYVASRPRIRVPA